MSPLFLLLVGVGFANVQGIWDTSEIKNNLTLIATADGKSFYVTHNRNKMNWFAGKEYCETRGMKLASVTSKAQEAVINDVYNKSNRTYSTNAWTSGRDAQLARQFTWDTTGTQMLPDADATTFNEPRQGIPPYQTCLWYYIGNPPGLKFWPCTREGTVMCEKYNA